MTLIDKYNVVADSFTTAGKISSKIKDILKQLGVPSDKLRKISVACYEAEINMIIHSDGGDISLFIDDENGMVYLHFDDVGPGIPDIEQAMVPGWSTASEKAREFGFGAGMGLVNIKRVSDNFDITSSSEGTHLKVGFQL
ncbi:MAG: ATP-binding protein [Erysipelotrichales bacterium]|nr:ATP-binding protein [Erysipelotrichales bacterium]